MTLTTSTAHFCEGFQFKNKARSVSLVKASVNRFYKDCTRQPLDALTNNY